MSRGKVIAVCTSEQKGTQKTPTNEISLQEDWGISGDAHAGKWHRQVSLLSLERIEEFRARGAGVDFGAFGENIVISGFDFKNLPIGTRFQIRDVLLEMTQIGKECHSHCAIYKAMGDCIMPREGVFTKVLHGGSIAVGEEVIMLENDQIGVDNDPSAYEEMEHSGQTTVAKRKTDQRGQRGEKYGVSGSSHYHQ